LVHARGVCRGVAGRTDGYRILSTGAVDDAPFNIYGYAFSIDSTKTVKSITLPKNRDVVILALDLTRSYRSPAAAKGWQQYVSSKTQRGRKMKMGIRQ